MQRGISFMSLEPADLVTTIEVAAECDAVIAFKTAFGVIVNNLLDPGDVLDHVFKPGNRLPTREVRAHGNANYATRSRDGADRLIVQTTGVRMSFATTVVWGLYIVLPVNLFKGCPAGGVRSDQGDRWRGLRVGVFGL